MTTTVWFGGDFFAVLRQLLAESAAGVTPSGLNVETDLLEEQTFAQPVAVSTLMDLGNMQAGDTIEIREYVRSVNGGTLGESTLVTLSGVQTQREYHVRSIETQYGYKITIKFTAGAVRAVPYASTRS